jgi:mono/diheme cytochrome c family protein
MSVIKISIIFISTILFIAACGDPVSNVAKNPTNSTNKAVTVPTQSGPAAVHEQALEDDLASDSGKEIYATNCMICHKDNGTGGKVTIGGKTLNAENLTEDKIKRMSDEKLIGYVTNGIPDEGMPSFKDKLSEAEIKAAVAHVRVLQK